MKSLAAVCKLIGFAKMVFGLTGHLPIFMSTKIVPGFLTSTCWWHLSLLCLETYSFSKVKMLFNFIHLAIISKTTYYTYQNCFICPVENAFYMQEQVSIIVL